ncbi:RNA binding protein protein [Babesia ovis]|uniref:RNA binding protein protein n=1 Tax=Babesia ovis TaxID=5869 RepID=A0A9W5WU04_BABOV|nr:RNA binding protein protein [Babesia ovis]
MAHVVGRLKKQKEDDLNKEQDRLEAARIYSEYVRDFEGNGIPSEAAPGLQFVKGGESTKDVNKSTTTPQTVSSVFDTEGTVDTPEVPIDEHSAIYLQFVKPAQPEPHSIRPPTGKTREIDAFIQELKEKQQRQDAERALQRRQQSQQSSSTRYDTSVERDLSKSDNGHSSGGRNILFVGNLVPSIQERDLHLIFIRFGPIERINILPSTSQDRQEPSCYAFVTYRNVTDAVCAKEVIDGSSILGRSCKIKWGHDDYRKSQNDELAHVASPDATPVVSRIQPLLADANGVTVVIPANPAKRAVIDLVARYVAEGGSDFEHMIMSSESREGLFSFIHDRHSPDHVYYRWKVYSILQGDSETCWSTEPFRIMDGGLLWHPPCVTPCSMSSATQTIPSLSLSQNGLTPLQPSELSRLNQILSSCNTTRGYIGEAMMFIINHGESAVQVTDCLVNAILEDSPTVDKKISRLYILSDVLYNTSASHPFGWLYRTTFEKRIPEIFVNIRDFTKSCQSKIAVQELLHCIDRMLPAWHQWNAYPPEYLYGLESLLWGPDISSFVELPHFDKHRDSIDPEHDGDDMEYFDVLSRFSLQWREKAYEYLLLRLKRLKQLCITRGLVTSPYTRPALVIRLVIYDMYVASRENRHMDFMLSPDTAPNMGVPADPTDGVHPSPADEDHIIDDKDVTLNSREDIVVCDRSSDMDPSSDTDSSVTPAPIPLEVGATEDTQAIPVPLQETDTASLQDDSVPSGDLQDVGLPHEDDDIDDMFATDN